MQRFAAAIAVYALILHAVLMGSHQAALPLPDGVSAAAEHAGHVASNAAGNAASAAAALAAAEFGSHPASHAAPPDCCISCAPGAGCVAAAPPLAPFLIAADAPIRPLRFAVHAPSAAGRWAAVTARGPPQA